MYSVFRRPSKQLFRVVEFFWGTWSVRVTKEVGFGLY
jgi:hypothetical protein